MYRMLIQINILTSQSAMQKLDPVLLSQINIKMQRLLEDMTTKNMQLETELRSRKA